MSQTKAQLIDGKSAEIEFTGGSASGPAISFTGDSNTGIYSPGADQVAVATNGTGRLFVDASGNVGVGAAPSIFNLGKAIEVGAVGNSVWGEIAGSVYLLSNAYYNSGFKYATAASTPAGGYNIYQNQHIWTTAAAGTAGNAVSFSERMRLTSTGLGIGTSSPGEQLDVSSGTGGVIRVTSSDGSISAAGERIGKIEMYSSDGSSNGTGIAAYIEAVSQAAFTGQGRPTHLTFGTYNSGGSLGERVRITDAGNVGIGTTSPGSVLSLYNTGADTALNIDTSSSSNNAFVRIQSGGVNRGYIGSAAAFGGSTGDFGVRAEQNLCFYPNAGSEKARIDTSGRLLVGTSTYSGGTRAVFRGNTAAPNTQGVIVLQRDSANPGTTQSLGEIRFVDSNDGFGAGISATPDGGWNSPSDCPTKLVFSTTADGASSPTERMRIDSSGRLGIGTTAPSQTLGVAGGVGIGNQLSTGTTGSIKLTSSGGTNYIQSGQNTSNASAGPLVFTDYNAFNEWARIDSSGRLLVGTSTASNQNNAGGASARESKAYIFNANATSTERISLAINSGSADASGASINLNKTRAATDTHTVVQSGDKLGEIRFQGSDGTFYIQGARIEAEVDGTPGSQDMPGRLVFSTTADGASSPTERMRISNDGSTNHYTNHTNVHIARSGNAAGTTDSIYVGVRSATNTTNGTVVYRVYTNGTYATISDANQKKNVETTRDGYLDDLNKLRVVKYNWNEQEDTDPKELGLIAQEVEQVFPGLVTQIADDTEEQQYKGIKTSVLPFMLLKALQEASAKIEVLEAEVAALKAQ
jgi:hypothetical protein